MGSPDRKLLERVRSTALKTLRADFPGSRADHEDFVQQALASCLQNYRSEAALLGLVVRRARGLALDRTRKSARELLVDVGSDAQPAFLSGKRLREKSTRSRSELDRIGRLFDGASSRLEHFVECSLLFDDDFLAAHFAAFGRLIESELKVTPPSDFVSRMMAFKTASARLSPSGQPEWLECEDTERTVMVGVTEAGKKPGRKRGRRGTLPLKGDTEFRLKRRDIGRLIAAHALKLSGFKSEEIHDLGKREARRESAFRELWTRKLEDACAAEPDVTTERILELTLTSIPGGPAIGIPEDQPPERHPAFRRRGRRAK